jgi:hypothetical protein
MSVLFLPVCPTTCTSSVEAVEFDECAPELHYGEISKLYVARADSANFTNVSLLAEWTTRLDDTGTDINDIRTLIGIGELPVPEKSEIKISGDRTIYSPKKFNLLFEVDETNDINYWFLLASECNIKFKFWYETSDGMLYGGNNGIEGIFNMDAPIPKDRAAVCLFMLSTKWTSKNSPLRCLSPNF